MAKMNYRKSGSFDFSNFRKQAADAVVDRTKIIMVQLTNRILELTPVWEGESIVNWRWSIGAPIMEHIEPIETPADPDMTSQFPLGTEPRRKPNEEPPRQSLLQALAALKTPQDVYLTNAGESIIDLEYGLLPTPSTSRNPKGMVRLALRELRLT